MASVLHGSAGTTPRLEPSSSVATNDSANFVEALEGSFGIRALHASDGSVILLAAN